MLPPPLARARQSTDPATLAFAGVIAQGLHERRKPLIRGLDEAGFRQLVALYVPGLACTNGTHSARTPHRFEVDEFDDIVALLLDYRNPTDEKAEWLVHAIATAAMGERHLWQDLGLPSRSVLSALMQRHFPRLAALNSRDMKWKKFFYRQLCDRAGIPICKSPNCADCCDYAFCFGPETD